MLGFVIEGFVFQVRAHKRHRNGKMVMVEKINGRDKKTPGGLVLAWKRPKGLRQKSKTVRTTVKKPSLVRSVRICGNCRTRWCRQDSDPV